MWTGWARRCAGRRSEVAQQQLLSLPFRCPHQNITWQRCLESAKRWRLARSGTSAQELLLTLRPKQHNSPQAADVSVYPGVDPRHKLGDFGGGGFPEFRAADREGGRALDGLAASQGSAEKPMSPRVALQQKQGCLQASATAGSLRRRGQGRAVQRCTQHCRHSRMQGVIAVSSPSFKSCDMVSQQTLYCSSQA